MSGAGSVPFWRQSLRGFSQCAFQANEVTAVFFVAAATVYDWRMGVLYVVSVIVATAVATALKGDRALLDLGLFGFNSGLMGLALGNFFVIDAAVWIAAPILAAIVAAITVAMARWVPIPFLAAPFIGTFWLLWPIGGAVGLTAVDLGSFGNSEPAFVAACVAALGSTLFSAAVGSGLLFLAGLLVSNWRHAVVAVMGAVLAVALAVHVGAPGDAVNSGFVGFNAVLAALAAWVVIEEDLRIAALAAIVATWAFSYVNQTAPFPALASGFVLTVWLLLLVARLNTVLTAKPAAGGDVPG